MDIDLVHMLQNTFEAVRLDEKEHKGTKKITITDVSGRPFGQLVEDDRIITIYDMAGQPYGKYNKESDYTTTLSGRPISRGNILASLLFPSVHKAK